jgi:hypothetical protein
MDRFERLVALYRTRASAGTPVKLDVLMDMEPIRGSHVVAFLIEVLRDGHESDEVRMYVVKRLRTRNGFILKGDRPLVAAAVGEVLADESNEQLRLEAALTLGDFTDVAGVLSRLAVVSLARDESIDLRYAAFTSLERAGPTPDSIRHMQQFARDEALGDAARNVLSAWHLI